MTELDKLIEQTGGNLYFPNIVFRKGALFTAHFGLDNTFNKLRIHSGVDRGKGSIYMPFDGTLLFIKDKPDRFGNLLIIRTEYDFEIRIGHIKTISDDLLNKPIKAGTYITEAGSEGLSTGLHTHTEIVSLKDKNLLLDEILFMKYKDESLKEYTIFELNYYNDRILHSDNIMKEYKEQRNIRGITFLNKYKCIRKDYLTNVEKTFYSSYYLFGM